MHHVIIGVVVPIVVIVVLAIAAVLCAVLCACCVLYICRVRPQSQESYGIAAEKYEVRYQNCM